MVVKVVATPRLGWSQQPSVPQTPCTTAMSSKNSKGRALNDVVLACRSTWLGTMSSKLPRSKSFEINPKQYQLQKQKHSHSHSIRRVCSASFDAFSDEEFSRKIHELAFHFQSDDNHDDDNKNHHLINDSMTSSQSQLNETSSSSSSSTPSISISPRWLEIQQEPLDWTPTASIEMKANSVDLPFSLRMIKKKKKQWQDEFIDASESAYCSVKKAFSSMVFIIRELHSYTLQMRELLFYEDLKGILARVQGEMHASFVWLFQQVFSHTPTLMVYVMILLANFTVHEMSAHAVITPPTVVSATVEEREGGSSTTTTMTHPMTSFSVSSPLVGGKTTSVGGVNGGGGGITKRVTSGTDGDGWEGRLHGRGVSTFGTREEESVSGRGHVEERESELWDTFVEEASRMRDFNDTLDGETVRRFVSPVTAKIEGDVAYEEFFRTELLYQTGLAQEPNNVLLLANYAQFLYLVAHDFDRAEEYFKRAIGVEPKDAEAHNKYATFLWQARNDLWAAEETYLEAISADPTNSFYAANYAHFLWNTGGEDTCFPLDSQDDDETLDA